MYTSKKIWKRNQLDQIPRSAASSPTRCWEYREIAVLSWAADWFSLDHWSIPHTTQCTKLGRNKSDSNPQQQCHTLSCRTWLSVHHLLQSQGTIQDKYHAQTHCHWLGKSSLSVSIDMNEMLSIDALLRYRSDRTICPFLRQ